MIISVASPAAPFRAYGSAELVSLFRLPSTYPSARQARLGNVLG